MAGPRRPAPARALLHRRAAWLLLALPVLFNAVALLPELSIGLHPLNDGVFHLVASERLGRALTSGENPLDAWLGTFSLGYPLWHAYQVLPHFVTGLLFRVTQAWADHAAVFSFIQYALLVTLPVGFAALARAVGMGAVGAGMAAALSLLVAGEGRFSLYGAQLGAYTWRGSGLYTQLWAQAILPWALAAVVVALRRGRGFVLASLAFSALALSHIVGAYAGAVSAVVLAVAGLDRLRGDFPRRMLRLALALAPAALLVAFFAVPMALDGEFINLSRWEEPWKWDSFGAEAVIAALVHGRLLDHGRVPVLTLVLGVSAVVTGFRARGRRTDRALLALALLWLALFFGRDTWGHLLTWLGLPPSTPLHRLQWVFEFFALLLCARGAEVLLRARAWRVFPSSLRLPVPALLLLAALVPAYRERADFLANNAAWGATSLAAQHAETAPVREVLDELHRLQAAAPGRVHAGHKRDWGGSFRAGDVPVYAKVVRDGMPSTSFLYHSMSVAADPMVLMDSTSARDLALFGVRYLVAPAGMAVGDGFVHVKTAGRFAVHQVRGGGYFDVVSVPFAYQGSPATHFEASSAWLKSGLRAAGQFVALYGGAAPQGYQRVLHRWEPLPDPTAVVPAGQVLAESQDGERYLASVRATQAAHVLFKMSFHPGLRATVDGRPVEPLMVTPGFTAIPVGPGDHDVAVEYRAGALKPALLAAGVLALAWWSRWLRRRGLAAVESRLLPPLRRLSSWLTSGLGEPWAWAAGGLAVLALRPCLRGLLMDGHDATEYPPRVVEFHENLRRGVLLPLWAPDLGNGYGQPLFEYVPPLFHAAAGVFHALGMGLATSVGAGAGLLGLVAALACYRLGVLLGSPRAGLVLAAAYLTSPYLQVDLYVRGNFMEFSGLAVMPLAALALLRLGERPGVLRLAGAAGAVALVMLSHNVIALIGAPALAVVAGAALGRSWRGWLWTAAAAAGGLAVSAFGWLPALVERGLVHVDRLREGSLLYGNHFVDPAQLLWSPWGYGLSVPGPGDGMPFMLGPAHLGAGVVGLVLALVALPAGSRSRRVAIGTAATVVAAAVMTTRLSLPLWDHAVTLQYLQFPWRFLALPALGLPVLAAAGVAALGARPWLQRHATAALVLLFVATGLPRAQPARFLKFDDEYYAPASLASRGINTTTREEYEPRTVQQRPPYKRERVDVSACGPGAVVDGYARASPEQQAWTVHLPAACRVVANTFFHPGWRASVDGESVPVEVEPVAGRIVVPVPAGEHRVALRLGSTPLRAAARGLSLAAAVAVAAALGVGWRRRRAAGAR